MTQAIYPILAQTEDQAGAAMFYVLALMAAGSAVGVMVSRNIVRTAVFLLFTLGAVAGLYLLLAAEFLAAVQLVVYAGGTLILIVFGVMLTSKSPFSRFQPKLAEVLVTMSIGMLLLTALTLAIVRAHGMFADHPLPTQSNYPVNLLGQALLGDYLLPFELASVLLLVVMIGAAFLAKARRRPQEEPRKSLSLEF
jgi:NADH:ubiquinone oxidoreductase subunit 6 (subunit J)